MTETPAALLHQLTKEMIYDPGAARGQLKLDSGALFALLAIVVHDYASSRYISNYLPLLALVRAQRRR